MLQQHSASHSVTFKNLSEGMESKKERRKRKIEEAKKALKEQKLGNEGLGKEIPKEKEEKSDDNVKILRGLNVFEFAQERVAEMTHMSDLISKGESERSQRIFQLFPRHMRRRAASHDIRRIPKKFREKARIEDAYRQVEAGLHKKKKPSRKHRRKPNNLMEEYQRRQKDKIWLETHIWHAKRFHMTEKWGFKLPLNSCQRGIKAVYRMSSKGCTIQDISFLKCFQISGSEVAIMAGLKQLTSIDTGLTFASNMYLSGTREGQCFLYSKNCYPYNAICPVRFLWKSKSSVYDRLETANGEHTSSESNDRTASNGKEDIPEGVGIRKLLIWCHPANFIALKNELESSFPLPEACDGHNDSDSATSDTQSSSHNTMSLTSDFDVTVADVSFELNRFRLTGPCSHSVMKESIRLFETQGDRNNHWWNRNSEICDSSSKINSYWRSCLALNSASELPSHVVLSLNVMDPRLNFPLKRESCFQDTTQDTRDPQLQDILSKWPNDCTPSPLWHASIRTKVKDEKLTESFLNKKRSESIIPEPDLGLGDAANRVPIMLIERPGSGTELGPSQPHQSIVADYGSGWDIILPAGWSMPFWMSFIYRGARAIGLQDSDSISTEGLQSDLLLNFPDTGAGQKELEVYGEELEKKIQRRPPNKRINYQRLGIDNPYRIPWEKVIKDWNALYQSLLKTQGSEDSLSAIDEQGTLNDGEFRHQFYVLRNLGLLGKLELVLSCGSGKRDIGFKELKKECENYNNALVPISLRFGERGKPGPNGLISIPSKDDLLRLKNDKTAFFGPEEPLHKGLKTAFRTIADEFSIDKTIAPTIGSNSRWILGLVTNGRYCYSRGKGGGVGLVSLLGFIHLIENQLNSPRVKVLVRSTTSLHYRFADVAISRPSLSLV